jgi:undecaprenyl-diphosphatase
MTIIQSMIFGLAEGLTEFIPVSSTAHLLLLQRTFGIVSSDALFAYLVLIQMGPLIALLLYFRRDHRKLIESLFARPLSSSSNRLAWYVVVGTVPALLAGVLLRDAVRTLFQTPLVEAAIRFFAAAILLALAEWFGKHSQSLDSMTWLDSLIIGLFQVLAVFPGASRSGTTISAGMLRNFDRPAATRFAFLLAAPVMLAAFLYESFGILRSGHLDALLPVLPAGVAIAFIAGLLSIRWLLGYVSSHSLNVFAVYCALIGAACLAMLWIG